MALKYFKAFVETGNKSLYVDTIGVFEEDITAEYMSGLARDLLLDECRLILFPAKENDEQGEEQNEQGCFCESCSKESCEAGKLTYKDLKRQYDDLSDNYSILQTKFNDALKKTDEPDYLRKIMILGLQNQIIGHYGLEAQKQKLKEEMTELAYAHGDENFIEEMADVLNVLEEIITHLDCWAKVHKIQVEKLERQVKRIEVESERKL